MRWERREERWKGETYLRLSLYPVWIYLYDSFTWMISVSSWPSLNPWFNTEKNNILLHFSHWRQREGKQGETDCADRRKGEKKIYGNVLKITLWYASDGKLRNLFVMCLVLEQKHSFNFIPSATSESSCCCSYLCVHGIWPVTGIYHWGSFKICKQR